MRGDKSARMVGVIEEPAIELGGKAVGIGLDASEVFLQAIGFETIAAGDSYNDLDMLLASKAGFLFRTTEKIKADYPQLPAFEEYSDLLKAIRAAL